MLFKHKLNIYPRYIQIRFLRRYLLPSFSAGPASSWGLFWPSSGPELRNAQEFVGEWAKGQGKGVLAVVYVLRCFRQEDGALGAEVTQLLNTPRSHIGPFEDMCQEIYTHILFKYCF